MPLGWGFGGIVASSGEVTGNDVRVVVDELARQRVPDVVLRPPPHQDRAFTEAAVAWTRTRENTSYEIDLSPGWSAVSQRFSSSVRRATRKAERSGVSVERRTDTEAMAEFFYPLYTLSVQRWARHSRLPNWVLEARSRHVEPLRKYEAVLANTGQDCGIWVAEHRGTVVAAIIVLSHEAEFAYWRGAMDVELAGPVRANDLLQVAAIEHACKSGGQRYAMGLTEPGSGLARFKSGFGAELRVGHEYALHSRWRSGVTRLSESVRSRVG